MVNPAVLTWQRPTASTGGGGGSRTYIWNPDGTSSELDGAGAVLRTNLAANPSVETNTDWWSTYVVATDMVRVSDEAWVGDYSAKLEEPDVASRVGVKLNFGNDLAMLPGETYTIQIRLKGTKTFTVYAFFGYDVVVKKVIGNAGRTRTPLADGWELISTTFTVKPGEEARQLWFYFDPIGKGGTWWYDGFHVAEGANIGDYFDGDTPDIN